MSDRGRKADGGPASRLHFEDTPQKDNPATSGQNVQRSRRGRRPVSEADPAHTESPDIPGASPAPRDAPDSRLRFENEDAPGTTPPQGTPSTSGQNVQKSRQGKFRRDGEKARPSDRLRHDEAPPPGGDSAAPDGEPAADSGPRPGGKKAARDSKRMNKSKFRAEKTGAKLDKARDKLAKQKPPKKPGPVKTVGRATGRQVHGYVHKKIHEVEHENVGVEAAHKTELVGESVVRGTTRFVKRRNRTRPARLVRKWEQKNIKARADHTFRTLAQEHPELNKNTLSRYLQKRKIKKQYQKQAREAAKRSAQAAKRTAKETKRLISFLFRHRKGVAIIIIIALVVMILMGAVSSCSVMFMDGISSVMGTTYPSRETDMLAVEAAYAGLETDLQQELDGIETAYPNYDEYRYDLAYIGHDPHQLAAYLSAVYQEYTLAEVRQGLDSIFDTQYILTLTETVEVRYRTETRTDSEGNSYTVRVAYNWYILNVKLQNNGLAYVAQTTLTAEQKQMYDIYQETKGNMPLLFGGGSINISPSEDLSGVHFVNGTRTGNQAIVDIAKSQVGNVGGQPYWSWYGFEGRVEWCACFVSWCINQAGYSEPRFAGCTSGGMGWFKSHGQWAAGGYSDIAPGDMIFFDWDNSGDADHVGIVIGKDATHVYTVEGNSGDACKIRSYPLDSGYIIGYGLMNW